MEGAAMSARPVIEVIGVGLSADDLTAAQRQTIGHAEVLAGGERLLSMFPGVDAERIKIGNNMDALPGILQERRSSGRRVVVLASGDPLCHGIGAFLIAHLGSDHIRIWPNVSSLAVAFARLGQSWTAAALVSLHGRRDLSPLHAALRDREWIAVLTDPQHTPAWLAGHLLERGCHRFRLCVLERLGTPHERLAWYDLGEARGGDFAQPNIAILQRIPTETGVTQPVPCLGLAQEAFDHQGGLITKTEARAVAISKLRLRPEHCLWDLGAGSGAVSIEAAAIVTRGTIVAVERETARCIQIRENRRRFGIANLEVIEADLPAGLASLPRPDRIFIGGGGKRLPAILRAAAGALAHGGLIVVNTVLLESLHRCRRTFSALGMRPEAVLIQTSRSRSMPWGERLAAENPVWIVSARKEDSSSGSSKP